MTIIHKDEISTARCYLDALQIELNSLAEEEDHARALATLTRMSVAIMHLKEQRKVIETQVIRSHVATIKPLGIGRQS